MQCTDVIKMFLSLSDFVTPSLRLLKDHLRARLLWFITTDSQTRLTTWQTLVTLQTYLFEDLQTTCLLNYKNHQIYQHSIVWYDD